MSPRRTFQSCGSSSRLARRSRRPARVTRGSSRSLNTGKGASFRQSRDSRRRSASPDIVRSFHIVKARPPAPTRVWPKNGGHPESSTTASANAPRIGARRTSPAAAPATSRQRFTHERPPARSDADPSASAERITDDPMSNSIERLDRIALTHDYLDQYGGAERTLARICDLFPSAPVHTSVYDRGRMSRLGFVEPAQRIVVSFMQSLPLRGRVPRYYFTALYPVAFRRFDLRSYDVVLSSATFAAKSLNLREDTVHVCYCYTPPRFLWGFDSETAARSMPPHERPLAALARVALRRIDHRAAQRVDLFV